MQDRRLAATDLTILHGPANHTDCVAAAEVVGRLITWLLDPSVRQQVNALTQGELVVNVGAADLTGHTVERVKVVIVKPLR